MEWEILMTTQVEEFLDALYAADRPTHRLVNQAILVLERSGPGEGRPLVDSITASQITNMKELRPRRQDEPKSASCSFSIHGVPPFCIPEGTGERGWR